MTKTLTLTIAEDNQKVSIRADENLSFPEVMQAMSTAILHIMRDCTDFTVNQILAQNPDQDQAALKEAATKRCKEELYDMFNCAASNVLCAFAPEIEAHPDLTAQALLDAENAFLQRQSQQKEDNADESLVATEEYR